MLDSTFDLVRAEPSRVAEAVREQVARFVPGEPLVGAWEPFESLASLWAGLDELTNVPTQFFVLATRSDWSVIWCNSSLCDGYDSLSWCLTRNYGWETMHVTSRSEPGPFQPGCLLNHRTPSSERMLYCCQNDRRWIFCATGPALPEEDLQAYQARSKKERLTPASLARLVERLGARPWEADFYPPGQVFHLRRTHYPPTIVARKLR